MPGVLLPESVPACLMAPFEMLKATAPLLDGDVLAELEFPWVGFEEF